MSVSHAIFGPMPNRKNSGELASSDIADRPRTPSGFISGNYIEGTQIVRWGTLEYFGRLCAFSMSDYVSISTVLN